MYHIGVITRRDISRLDATSAIMTPAGLRIPARLTRVGVLSYGNGVQNWGELKKPEALFDRDSLASLRGLAVTDLHPADLVSPDNWQDLARGVVADNVEADGAFVRADLVIGAGSLIDMIRKGDRVEISCGYHLDVIEDPGEYEGISYRYIHDNIRYNHVAVGPSNWGRAGQSVRLLDSKIYQVPVTYLFHNDSHQGISVQKLKLIRLDGTNLKFGDDTFDLLTSEGRAAFDSAVKAMPIPRIDQLEPSQVQPFIDQLSGQVQGLMSLIMQLSELVAAATVPPETPEQAAEVLGPELVAAVADARLRVVQRAKELTSGSLEIRSDWSHEQIMRKALTKAGHTVPATASKDYVQAVFDTVVVPTRVKEDSVVNGGVGAKEDEKKPETAQEMARRLRQAQFSARRKGRK